MTGNKKGDPFFTVQLQDQFPHFDDALRIQSVDRFIEDEKVRISCQCDGDTEPLLHAEREVLRFLLPGIFKSDKPEKLRDAVKGRQTNDTVLFLQIILGCHILIDRRSFYYRAHSPAASVDAGIVVFGSVDGIASGGRLRGG